MGLGLEFWKTELNFRSTIITNAQTTINTGGFIILINNIVIVLVVASLVLTAFFRKHCIRHVYALFVVVVLLILSLFLLAEKGKTDVVTVSTEVAEPLLSWRDKKGKISFHFRPALPGESEGEILFYAFRTQVPDTEPVNHYWDSNAKRSTFHFAPAWEGELNATGPLCYAFKTTQRGTSPVWDFVTWHGDRTLHFPPSWHGEKRMGIKFYAYRSPPCQDLPGKGTRFPVVVPLVAFFLGVASATIFAALYKWSTLDAVDEDLSLDPLPWFTGASSYGQSLQKQVRIAFGSGGSNDVAISRDFPGATDDDERSTLLERVS